MEHFNQFDLPEVLKASLANMNFTVPTPVQAKVIPLALQGRDVLASAQTGTGKTGAFVVPLVTKILANSRTGALVLTPTRELAVQVIKVIHQMLGQKSPVKTALLIGGEPMPRQYDQLKARPSIIVGTPGRINDHLKRGTLMLHNTELLVLDEADRMLDMGFGVQLDEIVKYLTKKRQTLMFSATMPPQIIKVSKKYLENPERVEVGEANKVATKIKQEIVHTTEAKKYDDLVAELEKREGSVIVFVKTKYGADRLAIRLLKQHDHDAIAIHGDLQQRKRDRVIKAFRNKRYRIMVATDVAARGLDIPHIEHVINYDLPQCPEDYIHRIGRTARAGAEGCAVSLITREDGRKWKAIERMLDPNASSASRSDEGGYNNRDNRRKDKPGGKKKPGKFFQFKRKKKDGTNKKRAS